MDDSRNSVTSGARGERTLIGAPRPAPRATAHFTHRPCYESPPATRRPRRVALAWAALALLGLLATVAPEQAVAQSEVTLVGNAGQPTGERQTANFQGAVDHAQQFTTGSNAFGYTLTKVEFLSNDAQSHTFSAQLCEANNTGEAAVPDPMNCQSLSTTSSFALSSVVVFTPPAGITITLAASTRYVVVLSENNSPSAVVHIWSTQADNQNGATGWTLANVFDWKQSGTTWRKQPSGRDALIMDVKGYVNTSLPAAVSDVVVVPVRRTTDSLTISWSAPDNTGKPALTGYEFRYKPTIGGTWTLVSHPGASTSVTVNGLEANGYYLVEVRALNADGSGPWSVTAESQTTPLPETVLANHPLIPDDLGPGDSFRLLHVTSGTTAATGTLIPRYHDTAAADVFPLVASGGLLGRWFEGVRLRQRALVSTAGADARLYTDTTWTSTDLGVPIYWINGARVADDYQDFYDGIWADEANPMNGFGEPRSLAGTAPWTGTDHDGTELFNGTASRAMGQASVSVGGPGSTIPGAGPLNGGVIFASTEERPVYGLWHVMVIDENLRLAGNLTLASTATEGTDERAAVRAQLFTTGPNPDGYGISYIYHWRGSEDPADASLGAVGLYTTDGDGDPDLVDGLHATLSLELTDSRSWTLEAPVGTVLKASTTYALVFQGADPAYPKLNTTVVDGEDVVAAGWSLDDVLRYHDGSNWVDNPDGFALSMDIIGPLVDVPAPGAPTTLTATASGTTQINISWTAPTDTGGSPITGYKIEFSPDGTNWTTLEANTNGPATTYAHTGLAAGTTRYYRVSAINTNGAGAPSNVDGATTGTTVPGAPTGLQATASGNTQIDLSWTAPGNTGGSPITGYRIEESPDGNSNWTTLEANTNGPATTYAHTGLAASTTRHYRVSAINTIGTSTASNVDDATTGTGTNTPATGAPTITGTAQVGQTLTAVTTAIMDADGLNTVSYTYQWIRVDGGAETNIPMAPASTYMLVTADQGKTIKVTVRFTDDANNPETLTSAATAAVSAAVNTNPPTVLIRDLSVREDIGRAEVPVTLTWAAQVVLSVPWSTSELNAKSPDDYTDGQGSVTFAPGVTEATISIPIFDDAVRESEPEFFAVTLGTGEGYLLEINGRAGATVAILDNDGDDLLPSLATVGGTMLVLTYDALLDGSTTPIPEHFFVTYVPVNSAHVDIDVEQVSVSGSTVTLILAAAVPVGQTVTLAYVSGDAPLQDMEGNMAVAFTGWRVINTLGGGTEPPGGGTEPPGDGTEPPGDGTEPPGGGGGGGGGGTEPTANTDPVITTPGPFDVEENQTRVVRIEALDLDPGDAIRSYAIAGGADGALFSIVAHTGVLSFREPPNFEAPADGVSTDPPSPAGDNEYIVVVRVASGPLARDRTVEQAFTVRVTDAGRESPGVPDAPRVTLALDTNLTVEWTKPENPGPSITDYDVQYREGTTGVFIHAPHEGTGRTATLTGLETATLYQVQVRARSEEGTGSWSEPGEGSTLADPPTMLPFSVPDGGGISLTSQGASPELRVGYGQVETDAGMTPPAGLAIFSSRVNGILVSEAGIPASTPVLEGRIFAETDGVVRTGIAMANPNDTAATVAFFFTNSEGIDSGHGTFTLGPREQIAKFLDEAPFNGGSAIEGTFTFSSNLPVAVIALRGLVNERSEFLMTTLPVAPIAVPTTGTVYFPHFAAGGGWTTQVILINPTHATISGSVQFLGSGSETEAAAPKTLTLADERSGSEFTYSIPPRSATRLQTSNPAGPLQAGSVRAVPDTGQTAPAGVSIFSFQKDGTTVSETGVPASTAGAAFRVYVEASGTPDPPGVVVRSGIALTNTSDTPTTVQLELTDLDGTATGSTRSLTLPASGHVARFIDEFFPTLTTPFSGILRITSNAPDIAIVGLRLAINQRNEILVTTTTPVDENAAAITAGLFFPHFVDSDGWTTQFILFSGSPGQTATGWIRFTGQDGQPMELSVAPTTAPMVP